MSTRRAPRCRTCGLPMKGHKRPGGITVCPSPQSSTTDSPPAHLPATPPRRVQSPIEKASHSPTPALATSKVEHPLLPTPPPTLPRTHMDPSFVIPEKGPWHRRNPNWEGNTPPPERLVPRAASLVPTVLVDDDGNTIQEYHEDNKLDDHEEVSRNIDPFDASIPRPGEPVVRIYSTKREDIQHLVDKATKSGIYTGMMRNPVKFQIGAESSCAHESSAEDSWLLVESRNPELVKLVINSQHYRMPGGMDEQSMNGPQVKLVTNLQLILLAILGPYVLVCMLSLL
ncbi:hypothetical protein L208DRAFT_1398987 [Tricholoma matsutake]|nr:hypothetical protein L208DRAFT_1398987 [Tricholoma matsutake 945]